MIPSRWRLDFLGIHNIISHRPGQIVWHGFNYDGFPPGLNVYMHWVGLELTCSGMAFSGLFLTGLEQPAMQCECTNKTAPLEYFGYPLLICIFIVLHALPVIWLALWRVQQHCTCGFTVLILYNMRAVSCESSDSMTARVRRAWIQAGWLNCSVLACSSTCYVTTRLSGHLY